MENNRVQTEQLEACNSYYMPSFFRIKVGVYDDFTKMFSIPFGAYSLFFHEYIHFIQDVSTVYGLMNLHTITYYLHEVASRVGKDVKNGFEVPQHLIYRVGDYGFDNFKLRPVYMGNPINPKRKKINITDYSITPHADPAIPTDIVTVTFEDTGTVGSFLFGGNHVCEGMAYMCESYAYTPLFEKSGYSPPEADDYPYNICQKLAEKIYPEISHLTVFLVAICDMSLMTYHPGLSYVRLLEHLKETNCLSKYTCDEELMSFIKSLYKDGTGFLKGSHVDFTELQNIVKDLIIKNFKCEEFKGNNGWINVLFERVNMFRTKLPSFVTDLLLFNNGEDVRKNRCFVYLLSLVGSPLIVNENNEGAISLPIHFSDPTFMPGLFWTINQVLRVFANERPVPCELKNHCLRSASAEIDPEIKVDERCDTAPWSRCSDERLCPFATIWRHWNLSEHYPVFKQ